MSHIPTTTLLTCLSLFALSDASAQCPDPGSVSWLGLEHCPLGAATITTTASNVLQVDNLGSSGLDGVRVALPPMPGNAVHSLFLDPSDVGGDLAWAHLSAPSTSAS